MSSLLPGNPISRFASSLDDAHGYLAFALFVTDEMGEDNEHTRWLRDRVTTASQSSISSIYFPAARRLCELIVDAERNAVAEREVQTHALLEHLKRYMLELHNYTEQNIGEINVKLSIPTQILVAAASGVIVGGFALVGLLIPSAFSSLATLFSN